MTNAELIKALRNCSDGFCSLCPYDDYEVSTNACEAKLMRDAADALEADEKRIAELEAQMPKEGEWIPVDDGMVYVKCSVCGDVMCCRGHYCPNCGAMMDGKEQTDAID